MIVNLSAYWRRTGTDPTDAPAHADGRRAIPAWLQAGIDDGLHRSTRNTPGYVGRHRACDCAAYDPEHNAHTEAAHTSCGAFSSAGLPCGGCDSCISAQATVGGPRD